MKKSTKDLIKNPVFIAIAGVLGIMLIPIVLPIVIILSPGILLYFMWKKTNWNKKIKITITCILGFFIFMIIVAIAGGLLVGGKNTKEMYRMLEIAQDQIKEGNITEAKKILLESKQKFNVSENPAIKLEGNINKLESEAFLKKSLIEISDTDIELLNKDELKKVFIENEKLNSLFLKKIKDNLQLRKSLLVEAEKNKQMADKIKKEQELAELKIKTQQERKAKIEKQFSAWDGSHITFSRAIKDNLNDPSSFEHVETRYEDKGTYILVSMKYRAKNGFGAIITTYANAKFTIDGDFIGLVK